jgi:hypothetical protein
MKGTSLVRGAATVATVAGLALSAGAAQAATTPCDPLGDVFCPGTGGRVQLTFSAFALGPVGTGQATALATGVALPPSPIVPQNPSTAYAQGKLYPVDPLIPTDPYLIGRVYAPTTTRPTWLFDGHLVPASRASSPGDPYRFVGVLLPPNPI